VTRGKGQALVEYAVLLPVFLMILLGILEFGLAFSHHLTMEYATREGARTGAALANGSDAFDCAVVDDEVVAAVQRVLTQNGSQIDLLHVTGIRIYDADANGDEQGLVDVWKQGKGPMVDGVALKFVLDTGNWDACTRRNAGFGATDSIGVALTYDYQFVTPLGSMLGLAGGGSGLAMSDRTVMALNPD
jgi:hypothetical protein